jgi:hypothetical protein
MEVLINGGMCIQFLNPDIREGYMAVKHLGRNYTGNNVWKSKILII